MKLVKILLIITLFFSMLSFYGIFRIFWVIDEKDDWLQEYLDEKFFEDRTPNDAIPRYQARGRILGPELQNL